jgi:hypothetical protein
VLRTLLVLALAACRGGETYPPATIVDLSSSVAELRTDFDAHKAEPRFVTLVSPT